MEIRFATKKLEKSCSLERDRARAYGPDAAKALLGRLTQLYAAADLSAMRSLPGGCHELLGDRRGEFAVNLTKGLRLVFQPTEQPPPTKPDGGIDWSEVTAITILEVTDYHGS